MASTPSTMLPLGTVAAPFELMDAVTGKTLRLQDVRGSKGTLLFFICNHCPFVVHANPMLAALGKAYQKKGTGFIAISSNDVEKYPQDGPHRMKAVAHGEGYSFPYLYDETQEVAKAYQAACTPDFFLFNERLALVYRGQLDASRPGSEVPLTGKDLKNAMDALLEGRPKTKDQKPSVGCNIKWES
jgi:thiol-disulfide isomerase/thioredoxin